ncbi:hemerythrin domain-containing protein [Roseateles terrae]|uniref:Hemerythrin-like domain-containing protein n=1 Tax=Roseateles terrae TaxID=431060 RepID=A0ABR6GKV5_9BURK|nr:hemerythrin domain-containing protein [Roseateles terrae]MBB3192739.1 hemerythrin-like domain-containing protein [Roseateles terrae]OWQ89980.1 hypothetical protein CDN98_05720 [Roseateles terrae]
MSHVFQQFDMQWQAERQARDEVVALLMDDHQQSLLAFRQYDRLRTSADAASREAQVRRICALVTLHATLEEELFYPALRRCPDVGAAELRLVHEAEVEQLVVRILMAQLRRMEAQDTQFDPLVGVLSRYVEHHVKDVEQGILPRLNQVASLGWQQLALDLQRRREELLSKWATELQGDAGMQRAPLDASVASGSASGSVASSGSSSAAPGAASRLQRSSAPGMDCTASRVNRR